MGVSYGVFVVIEFVISIAWRGRSMVTDYQRLPANVGMRLKFQQELNCVRTHIW